MPDINSLAGPKIITEGPTGTGKTFALGTLVDWAQKNGARVHVLFTENGLESLLGYWRDRNLPVPECLAWHVVPVAAMDLTALIRAAKDAGSMNYEGLTKQIDPDRARNNPWEKFLTILTDVPDDRTKKNFGNIGTWGTDQILVVDSMSEAANLCFKMQVGKKPVASQPDYQVAQQNFLNWLRWMTQSLRCTFVITAHVQRQTNELTGITQIMTKVIGRALSDEVPQLFSEVIYTRREGTTWVWDTAATNVDTKTRYLPISQKLDPNYAQIMSKWLERGKV